MAGAGCDSVAGSVGCGCARRGRVKDEVVSGWREDVRVLKDIKIKIYTTYPERKITIFQYKHQIIEFDK